MLRAANPISGNYPQISGALSGCVGTAPSNFTPQSAVWYQWSSLPRWRARSFGQNAVGGFSRNFTSQADKKIPLTVKGSGDIAVAVTGRSLASSLGAVTVNTPAVSVTLDNAGQSVGATSVSSSVDLTGFTVGSGSNRLLVVAVSLWAASARTVDLTNSKWNGSQTFTLLDSNSIAESGGQRQVDILYLLNPASATGTIHIVFSGGVDEVVIGADTWTGVNQSTPFGTPVKSSGIADAFNVINLLSVSSASGNVVHDFVSVDALTSLSVSNQTARWDALAATNTTEGGGSTAPGGGSVAMQWTWEIGRSGGSGFFAHTVVDIKAASSTTVDVTVSLTGLSLASAQGSPSPAGAASVAASGRALSASAGTATLSGGAVVTLTGRAAALGEGTVNVSTGAAISVGAVGMQLLASPGTVSVSTTASVSVSAVGALLSASCGTVDAHPTVDVSVNLTGAQLLAAAANVAVAIGAIAEVIGNASTLLLGEVHVTVSGQGIFQAVGVEAQLQVGSVSIGIPGFPELPISGAGSGGSILGGSASVTQPLRGQSEVIQ
jgi:hypothetical protein